MMGETSTVTISVDENTTWHPDESSPTKVIWKEPGKL